MSCLLTFSTPQLLQLHKGKVRDSFRVNDETRMIVVTDRISAFNKNSKTPIPHKGAILNGLANFWFENTKDIIDNHLIKVLDPNVTLVKEAVPIKVEMIVRAYLTGSMWRAYQKGQRVFSGVLVPDGLQKNDRFPSPILTPTTKDEFDTEITPQAIVESGLIDKATYDKMAEKSLALFQKGSDMLAEKGMILVDTKYEFGLVNNELILIDEIHTPDSSRFWSAEEYKTDQVKTNEISKEFVRQWLLANKDENGQVPDNLPEDIVAETSKRYQEIYEKLTAKPIQIDESEHIKSRMTRNLCKAGLIKDGYIAIIMGSTSDLEHCNKIMRYIEQFNVMIDLRVVSAHKNGEELTKFAELYNNSIEPGAIIAVASRSNGLGGALSANLNTPVINCPPFKDRMDMMVNINSSLIMASKTPASTVIHADNAAYAALRSLNLPRLRELFSQQIRNTKASLKEADNKIRKGQWFKDNIGFRIDDNITQK